MWELELELELTLASLGGGAPHVAVVPVLACPESIRNVCGGCPEVRSLGSQVRSDGMRNWV